MLGTNWKTTLLGILTILGGAIKVAVDLLNGGDVDFATIGTTFTIGMGLITAKDAGVSGTSK